ncbi:MAG: hypothetical protein MUC88_00140 [Planctomycetes bacterium]|jgi:hypothetical protein|nr:hypothetical protein [Planctomycetota bacterium]
MSSRSVVAESRKSHKYQPEDIEEISDIIARWFEAIRAHETNKVLFGVLTDDPTTPSDQATGTGDTLWNINYALGQVVVDGVVKDIDALADFAIHSGSFLTGLTSGKSCRARIVAKNVAGTITVVAVKGTPATTGSEKAPSDADVQAAVGANNQWIELAQAVLNRTGDTSVTQAQYNQFRPILGVTVDETFGDL